MQLVAMATISCPKGHLPNAIAKKDYPWIKLTKMTPSAVAVGAPGDMWHMPPRGEAAAPTAMALGGRLQITGINDPQRNRLAWWALLPH